MLFLAAGLAGAVFGALAAGLAVHWLQGAREKRALQALITQVHLKRALAENGPGALDVNLDAARCRSAVADIRQQVRETLSELRPGSASPAAVLLEMYRACDAYLRETEGSSRNYEARMRELRLILNQSARRLSSGRHVQYLAPGERAGLRRDTGLGPLVPARPAVQRSAAKRHSTAGESFRPGPQVSAAPPMETPPGGARRMPERIRAAEPQLPSGTVHGSAWFAAGWAPTGPSFPDCCRS